MRKIYNYKYIFIISAMVLLLVPCSVGDSTIDYNISSVMSSSIKECIAVREQIILLEVLVKNELEGRSKDRRAGMGPRYKSLLEQLKKKEEFIKDRINFITDILLFNEPAKSPRSEFLPVGLMLVIVLHAFTRFKYRSVLSTQLFTSPTNLFRFVLSEEAIEALECDAIEYSEDKIFPWLYRYYYLMPCLVFQACRRILKRLIIGINKPIR